MNTAKANIIGKMVELEFGVSPEIICGPSKKREHCTARTIYVALLEMAGGFNSKDAAKHLNRSQEDINHIRRQHIAWSKNNVDYIKLYDQARRAYKTNLPDLNDIELEEVRSDLVYTLEKTQLQLAHVVAEQLIRMQSTNQHTKQ